MASDLRRCAWCRRELSRHAKPGQADKAQPHCGSPTCNWCRYCYAERYESNIGEPPAELA